MVAVPSTGATGRAFQGDVAATGLRGVPQGMVGVTAVVVVLLDVGGVVTMGAVTAGVLTTVSCAAVLGMPDVGLVLLLALVSEVAAPPPQAVTVAATKAHNSRRPARWPGPGRWAMGAEHMENTNLGVMRQARIVGGVPHHMDDANVSCVMTS
jgi:hypothetical protein